MFRCFDWLSRKCVSFLTLSMFSGFSQNSRSSTVFCLLAFSNKHRTPFREKTKTTKIHGKQKQDMTLGETICPVSINCSCVFSCPRVLFLWLARVFPQMHDEFAGQHHTQKKMFPLLVLGLTKLYRVVMAINTLPSSMSYSPLHPFIFASLDWACIYPPTPA